MLPGTNSVICPVKIVDQKQLSLDIKSSGQTSILQFPAGQVQLQLSLQAQIIAIGHSCFHFWQGQMIWSNCSQVIIT
jgi:hypothetical protein